MSAGSRRPSAEAAPGARRGTAGGGGRGSCCPRTRWLVIAYLVFPIVVMIIYSFNKVSTGCRR